MECNLSNDVLSSELVAYSTVQHNGVSAMAFNPNNLISEAEKMQFAANLTHDLRNLLSDN